MVMCNLAAFCSQAAVCLPSAGFDAATALEAIEKHKCTTLYGVPTMFIQILNQQLAKMKDITSVQKGKRNY
jgi:fatty-acyl-CoA synthase